MVRASVVGTWRIVSCEGRRSTDSLVLETAPVASGGGIWTFRLVWARAVPAATLATAHSPGRGATQ
jgi:hypothetical protein